MDGSAKLMKRRPKDVLMERRPHLCFCPVRSYAGAALLKARDASLPRCGARAEQVGGRSATSVFCDLRERKLAPFPRKKT